MSDELNSSGNGAPESAGAAPALNGHAAAPPSSAAPPAQPAAQPSGSPPANPLRESWSKHPALGQFAGQYKSDEELTQGAAQLYANYQRVAQALPQLQQQAQYGQYVQQHWDAFQQYLAQQQAAAQPEAAQQPQRKWQPPEFDRRWLQFVEKDDQGRIVPIPGAAPDLPQKIRSYAEWREQAEDDFFSNPFESPILQDFKSQLIDDIRQEFSEAIHQSFQNYRQQSEMMNWLTDKRDLLIQTQNGQPVLDPITGQPAYTEVGQKLYQYADQLAASGVQNPAQKLDLATRLLKADAYDRMVAQQQAQPSQGGQPPAAPAQPRPANRINTAAVRRPSQAGAVIPPEPNASSHNPKTDLRTRMLNAAKQKGVIHG